MNQEPPAIELIISPKANIQFYRMTIHHCHVVSGSLQCYLFYEPVIHRHLMKYITQRYIRDVLRCIDDLTLLY